MPYQIELRSGTAAEWTAADPVLAQGEPGVETDTGRFKLGNGVSAWAGLAYASGAVSSVAGRTGVVTLGVTDVAGLDTALAGEQTRAETAEAALSATVAALQAHAWAANVAYPAESLVSNGAGLYEAPVGGAPARAVFSAADWTHLGDIATPVGTTAGTVAAGDDPRIVAGATQNTNPAPSTLAIISGVAFVPSVTHDAMVYGSTMTGGFATLSMGPNTGQEHTLGTFYPNYSFPAARVPAGWSCAVNQSTVETAGMVVTIVPIV